MASSFCHKCRRIKTKCSCPKSKRRNESMRRWYNTARWARLRMYVGTRDMWLCQECLRAGKDEPGNEIDHIRRAGDKPELFWNADNLQTLCRSCHSRKTRGEGVISNQGGSHASV